MSCNCGGPIDDYDDYSRETMSTAHTTDSASSAESEVLVTTYKKVTPLFRQIEKEHWEGVLMFLSTGKWSNSMFSSSNHHLKSPSPEIQAKTWVTSYDRNGTAEWSQLPLHAAISYLAPSVVIQKLIELYPKSVQCTDNEGMLPIHLGFGFGSPDNVLAMLLEPFPAAVNEKGLGDRVPHECCELGPNKVRGKVFSIIADETKKATREEIDREWRGFALSAQQSLGMDFDIADKELTEFMLELMQNAKELQEVKKEQQRAVQKKNTLPSPRAKTVVAPTPKSKKRMGRAASKQARKYAL